MIQEEIIIKMSISEKIKTNNNEIKQSSIQFRKLIYQEMPANMNFCLVKDLLESAVTLKRSEYSPLGKESEA